MYSFHEVFLLFFKQDAQFFFTLSLCTWKNDCFAGQFFWDMFLRPGKDVSLFWADELTFEDIEWSKNPIAGVGEWKMSSRTRVP